MALKFLNKKGWHTGSLANIERVWKKEQAHKEEQRKLEEFKKQIAEEAEKAEFRQLQIDAGLVPRQERVDFLYEPGVSKGGSDGFKTLEALPTKAETDSAAAAAAASSSQQQGGVPGALFEEKPQSANDTWRKLHSDPLLMIKQREQEALARIRNNPVQMAKLKKSVEDKKEKKKKKKEKEKKKHSHKNADNDYTRKRDKFEKYSSDDKSDSEYEEKRTRGYGKYSSRGRNDDKYVNAKDEDRNRRGHGHWSDSDVEENRERRYDKHSSAKDKETSVDEERSMRNRHYGSKKEDRYHSDSGNEERRNGRRHDRYPSKDHGSEKYHNSRKEERYSRSHHRDLHSSNGRSDTAPEENRKRSIDKTNHEMHSPQRAVASNTNMGRPHQKHRGVVTKLSEEEKAARLKEMQMDAVLHEEQRWNRLKKASENDAKEASQASSVGGANFLNAAQKSVYGADKGGSSTIEESVRRRKYFSQGRSDANEGNAFRR